MPRDEQVFDAFVALADTLVADYDPAEFLYTLADHCVTLLDAAAAGVLLLNGGSLDLVAASSHEMRVLEVIEGQQHEGPCYEAYRTGQRVTVADLAEHQEQWPTLVPMALERGFRSVHGEPLRLRDDCIGALDVFWSTPGRPPRERVQLARALASMAAIGILHERALSAAGEQNRALHAALEKRADIEQAKAVLAERLSIDPGDAFERLRRYSRDHNERLRVVAQRLLDDDLPARAFMVSDER